MTMNRVYLVRLKKLNIRLARFVTLNVEEIPCQVGPGGRQAAVRRIYSLSVGNNCDSMS